MTRRGGTAAVRLGQPMTRRLEHHLALAALLASLAAPATAAASPSAVVRDCAEDGSVDGNYSNDDKKAALGQIPADLDEYSDCRAVISASIKSKRPSAKATSSDSGDDSASADAAVPAKAKRRRAAARSVRKRKQARARTESLVADRSIAPAAAGAFDRTSTENGLSLPVLLALIALTLLLLGGAFFALTRRNPGLLAAVRRVSLPRRGR